MKIKIQRNTPEIKLRIDSGEKEIKIAVTEAILDYSNKLIPKADNYLRNSGEIHSQPSKGLAIWNTKYARYQWYGVWEDGTHKVKHYTEPGTGTMWAEKAARIYEKEIQKVAQNAFAGGMNKK